MRPGLRTRAPRRLIVLAFLAALVATSCGSGLLKKQYEYEEELYLALDGSATINLNASVAALVALRGVDLPLDPRARLDREQVRALFRAPGAETTVSLSRRDGRRFVHVSIALDDLRQIPRLAPFSWSTYRLDPSGDSYEYRQMVGAAAGKPVGEVGWTGKEIVAFRLHIPSKIDFHNAPSRQVERGNILEWEQPLRQRLEGEPVDLQVQMQAQSILSRTLLIFGGTILAAALTFAVIIWWVSRRGRNAEMAESRP